MTLTVVMAHAAFSPQRQELMPSVAATWGDHLHHIIADDVKQGAWATVRSCWQKALEISDGKGHVLAAQDDFTVAAGGAELMTQLCAKFPDRVISFRWPRASCSWLWHLAVDRDTVWAKANHAWTGGAVALPAYRAEEFLTWAERFDELGGRNYPHADDARLDMWSLSTGIPVWRTRWTLLHHVGGSFSVVRNGATNDSPEMGLVADVAEVPSLDDPRWDDTDVPEYDEWPEGFKLNASTMLKGRGAQLGLK